MSGLLVIIRSAWPYMLTQMQHFGSVAERTPRMIISRILFLKKLDATRPKHPPVTPMSTNSVVVYLLEGFQFASFFQEDFYR